MRPVTRVWEFDSHFAFEGLYLRKLVNICMYVCMYVCISVCLYVYMYVYMYVYGSTQASMCECMHVCIFIIIYSRNHPCSPSGAAYIKSTNQNQYECSQYNNVSQPWSSWQLRFGPFSVNHWKMHAFGNIQTNTR